MTVQQDSVSKNKKKVESKLKGHEEEEKYFF